MVKQVCEFSLTQEEYELLQKLKDIVKQNPISSQIAETYPIQGEEIFYSDSRLIRFLFAREKNLEKATQMWIDWAKWYLEQRPETITLDMIQEEIDAKKAFWFKQDKNNNPNLVIIIKNHIPVYEKIEQGRKFFIYIMEQGIKKAEENGTHRLTIIWDGKGFQKSQLNSAFLDFIKLVSKLLQDYYPSRLAAVYITDPDFLFKLGYTILKPFLSKVITSKIQQIPMKDLHKYFSPDCILPEHGGDANQISPLSPNYIQDNPKTNTASITYQNQNNHLHIDQQHHSHFMSSNHFTEEFHSIANDSKIFYDNQSYPFIQLANHDQNNQNQQFIIEGHTNRDQQSCCSTQCSIF